jgi:hypothetical protein
MAERSLWVDSSGSAGKDDGDGMLVSEEYETMETLDSGSEEV